MAWPPIDERLKAMTALVTFRDERLDFRLHTPELNWKFRRQLFWFFRMPREQRRWEMALAAKPVASPEQIETWRIWTNENLKIHPDWDQHTKLRLAFEAEQERQEGSDARTYSVERTDNYDIWPHVRLHFQPLNKQLFNVVEIIERAMNMKRDSLPPDEYARFFHSYIA
ncbi:MAG: hypothetical protein ABL889_10405 [Terricaulis sp.]